MNRQEAIKRIKKMHDHKIKTLQSFSRTSWTGRQIGADIDALQIAVEALECTPTV